MRCDRRQAVECRVDCVVYWGGRGEEVVGKVTEQGWKGEEGIACVCLTRTVGKLTVRT